MLRLGISSRVTPRQRFAAKNQIISSNAARRVALGKFYPCRLYSSDQGANNGLYYIILYGKYFVFLAIITLCPEMISGDAVDKLCRNANALSHSADASFNQIPNTEFTTHPLH